jgi:hypothetical protein
MGMMKKGKKKCGTEKPAAEAIVLEEEKKKGTIQSIIDELKQG